MELKELAGRLDRLEDAHRALAAQHTALLEAVKFMLDRSALRARIPRLRNTLDRLMDDHGQDADYQHQVRQTLRHLIECAAA